MWLALLFLPVYLITIALGLIGLSYLVMAVFWMTVGVLHMVTRRLVGTRANPQWVGIGFIELGVAFLMLAGATAIGLRHHGVINVIVIVVEGLVFFAATFSFVMAYRRPGSRIEKS
jgi:hypothetical protein